MFPVDTNVLLIDDIKGVRVLVGKLLKNLGYNNIMEAGDGQEAWEILESSNNKIGLIICDYRMPKMDGMMLLKKVRGSAKYKETAFLMLTAESEREAVIEAVRLGVNEYIIKPANQAMLSKKLENVWKAMEKTA